MSSDILRRPGPLGERQVPSRGVMSSDIHSRGVCSGAILSGGQDNVVRLFYLERNEKEHESGKSKPL